MRLSTAFAMFSLCACGEVDPNAPDAPMDPTDVGADAITDASGDGGLGPWSAPVRIDVVSVADFNDSYPAIRADGLELYFVSNRDGGSTDIYVSGRLTTAHPWGTPMKAMELDVASSTEGGPELSDDGKTIWFARALVGGSTGNDIYTASRDDLTSPWGRVAKVAELSTTANERSPHVSSDGKTMWFTRHDGVDYDVWVATRGSITAPWNNLREVTRFSSAGAEDKTTTTGDGQVMYFDSDRDGAATIYTSTGGGPWSIPAAVSELDGYFRPDVTPDGRTMVLTRIAADGKTDVYQSTR